MVIHQPAVCSARQQPGSDWDLGCRQRGWASSIAGGGAPFGPTQSGSRQRPPPPLSCRDRQMRITSRVSPEASRNFYLDWHYLARVFLLIERFPDQRCCFYNHLRLYPPPPPPAARLACHSLVCGSQGHALSPAPSNPAVRTHLLFGKNCHFHP